MDMFETGKAYARVIAMAWKDPNFKKKLLKDPRKVLARHGIVVPDNVQVKVEDGEHQLIWDPRPLLVLPLPPLPASITSLSDEDLDDESFAAIRCCCPPPEE